MFRTKKLCLAITLLSSFFSTQEAQANPLLANIGINLLCSAIYDIITSSLKYCKTEAGKEKCSQSDMKNLQEKYNIIEEFQKNKPEEVYSQKDREMLNGLYYEIKQIEVNIRSNNALDKKIETIQKDVNELKRKYKKSNSQPRSAINSHTPSLPAQGYIPSQPSYNFSLPTIPNQQPSTFSLPSTPPQSSYNFSLPSISPQPSYNFSSQPSYHNEHTRHHSRNRRWYSSEFSPSSSYSQGYPDDSNRHHSRNRWSSSDFPPPSSYHDDHNRHHHRR